MEKKVLLAVTLSIVVILVYPIILAKINPALVIQTQKSQLIQKQEVIEKNVDTNLTGLDKESQLAQPIYAAPRRLGRSRTDL